jgi:hypothetical protein
VSYLAAEAKCQAKQANDNVYHISPCREYETAPQELLATTSTGSAANRYSLPRSLPPALAQFTVGHLHRDPELLNIVDRKAHWEVEQKVY